MKLNYVTVTLCIRHYGVGRSGMVIVVNAVTQTVDVVVIQSIQ